MKNVIVALDQGTTSTRAIAFDAQSKVIASAQIELGQMTQKNGWVEQNANEIFDTALRVINEVANRLDGGYKAIQAIGITNQRETTILWDKHTGEPVYHAIVWQSRQSASICEAWEKRGLTDEIKAKTGLPINPYFSASKIAWLIENIPGLKTRIEREDILFGTVDTWLTWKLSKGKSHITDVSNASRTMLFNLETHTWDPELCEKMGIPLSILPTIVPSHGTLASASYLEQPIQIAALIGDQQSALFGHCCFDVGDIKNTYGTGCFMLMNTGQHKVISKKGLLTTVAWEADNEVIYALEGSVFVAGAAVQWLRDGLAFFERASDCERIANKTQGENEVFVVPAFVGLGTPYWDSNARGAMFGLTRATTKEHITRATLDAIAYQSKDVMDIMREEANTQIQKLAVDGGASHNNYLMQFQADILQTQLIRPHCLETTALGAAYLAGLATGFWKDKAEIKKLHAVEHMFYPQLEPNVVAIKYENWKRAVHATRSFKPL